MGETTADSDDEREEDDAEAGAYERLMAIAEELRSKSAAPMTRERAFAKAYLENPKLAQRERQGWGARSVRID